MITLKRAKTYQDRIAELEKANAALKEQSGTLPKASNASAPSVNHQLEITKLNHIIETKNNELEVMKEEFANASSKLAKALADYEELKANFDKEVKSQATLKAVDIVASQGIPMIKLDPDKDPGSITSDIPKDRQAIIDLYRNRSQQNNIEAANRFNNNNNKNRK